MNTGKPRFAQMMVFLPWTTFARLVEQHGGDRYAKLFACTEQFRVMAFAQLTYCESLRHIEVRLSAQAAKLYHMGFRHEIKRSTLADANETRDWRIHAEFAQCLIARARRLNIGDSFGTISRKDYPVHLRRIRFKDPETGKTLVFLTNTSQ